MSGELHHDSQTMPVDERFFEGSGTLTLHESNHLFSVGTVHFEPACRNHWHTHPIAQILVVTKGFGIYQEEGQPPRLLQTGDVITTSSGINHWHGACADYSMEHVAITLQDVDGSAVTWGRAVSASEYENANAAVENTISNTSATGHAAGNTSTMNTKVSAGRDQLGTFAPEFAHLNDDVLFAEVWSRQAELSARDRSLVTVVSLMASGVLDESLRFHLQTAKANGITKTEISEAITHAAFYVGWPKAWAVFSMAKTIWE
jgi:4-carboxymuconolactone decarboxylase